MTIVMDVFKSIKEMVMLSPDKFNENRLEKEMLLANWPRGLVENASPMVHPLMALH